VTVPADAPAGQEAGDAVGHLPQLGVGRRLLVVDDGHFVGVALDLLVEQCAQVDAGGVAGVDPGRPELGGHEIGAVGHWVPPE